MNLLLYLWGVYVGLGAAIGVWFYVDDDYPWDDPWSIEFVQSVAAAILWGPIMAAVIIDEVLL